jgi:hypothetical protein
MGNKQTYETIYDFEKPIHKMISDYIVKIENYTDKKFHILLYDYDNNENVLMACKGYLLVNHGHKIFQEFNFPLLCWIYVFDEKQFLLKIKHPILGKIRLLKFTEEML